MFRGSKEGLLAGHQELKVIPHGLEGLWLINPKVALGKHLGLSAWSGAWVLFWKQRRVTDRFAFVTVGL